VTLLDDLADLNRLRAQRAELLAELEFRYAATLRAILAVPGERESDDDLNRWRGHAEAYRHVCERLRVDAGLPPVRYQSSEWRAANV
jgi:hypothetical protein